MIVIRQTICIAPTHPALPGHFPGNPIVPGVVLLTEIIAAVRRGAGGQVWVKGMPTIKFVAPVRAQDSVSISFTPGRPGLVRFECHSGQDLIATGSMEIETTSARMGPA